MIRTVITLDDKDKTWLDVEAKKEKVSMAAVIRKAIREYRKHIEKEPTFEELLEQTKGIWKQGDGLKYQTKLRKEWEK